MKPRIFLTLILLVIVLLVSCAPAKTPAPASFEVPPQNSEAESQPPSNEADPTPATLETDLEAVVDPTPTEAVELEPEFVPKGPELEATDPSTVVLVSGGLQLVEFFRYT